MDDKGELQLEDLEQAFTKELRAENERLKALREAPQWGTWETVDEVGWYWWLSGYATSTPFPVEVRQVKPPEAGSPLVAKGLPSWGKDGWFIDDIDGHWMKIAEPEYESILGDAFDGIG